jgi:2-succinyl-5-enolpyruvyl-6-hydroxy-3-cyclohexene-1-carboxylate synthase
MTGPEAADVQAAFCTTLVDEWARGGVADAVVAPGSRSTPIVLALDGEPRIRVHVVLDERSAGFVTLGLALGSGRPAVVATTSGTAAVELHPAVVEAAHASVPLIAVTADRPPELHEVGAPQTVRQADLYGPAVRWAVSPGVAERAAAASWRSLAARCVAEALTGPRGPGPVHCNLAFREPLLGAGTPVDIPPGRSNGAPWHTRATPAATEPPTGVIELLTAHAGGRGLIVAGAGAAGAGAARIGPVGAVGAAGTGVDPAIVVEAGRRLGWPVLADPRSGCRIPAQPVVGAADALLRVPEVAAWRPEVVLRLGAPWASKVLTQWLAALGPDVPQILVDPWGQWADPDRRVEQVVAAQPADVATALAGIAAVPDGSPIRGTVGPGWARQWADAERAAQQALSHLLGEGGPLALSEPGVARAVVAGLPDGGVLMVSSSMPVRDVEWYAQPRHQVDVVANRGANGIDGVLSTAVGVAVGSGAPVVALLGDLAFLYDAGALLGAVRRQLALTVVVVDNDGGGIFSFLYQSAALPAAQFERYWGTPQGADILAIAAAYGAEAMEVTDRSQLDRILGCARQPGVRVGVVRSDRAANVAAHDRLHGAVAAAVGRR